MELDAYLSQKHKKRKKKKTYFSLGIGILVAYAVLASIFWFIFHAPFFRMDTIVVRGNDTVASGDVIDLLHSSVLRSGDSIKNGNSGLKSLLGFGNILIWPGTLPSEDLALIPQLANISLSKSYLAHTVTATVTERVPVGIWCFNPSGNEQCYSFDATGMMFGKSFDTEGSLMIAVHDYSQTGIGVGSNILPAEFIPNLISILDAIKASGLNAKEVALNDLGLQEIDVTTYDGPAVYFSLRFSAAEDLSVLESIMAKSDFAKLQYIDFRVQNRAYYK